MLAQWSGGGKPHFSSYSYLNFFLNLLILLICYAKSLASCHYANFYPINGTFQNFNPVRRLLDGQIPFSDFYDYLGLGHMYSGAFASIFIGDTYQDSLVVFEFLTLLSFSLLSIVIGKCIIKNYTTVAIFTIIVLLSTMQFENIGVINELKSLVSPGNSARLIRGMGLPLSAIFFLFCIKNWNLTKEKFSQLNDETKITIILGSTAGLSILWSNDYGFSNVGAIALLVAIQFFFNIYQKSFNYGKITIHYLKLTIIFTISLLISFFIFGEILTYGNIHKWLSITIGIGQYQNWYYNSGANFYIYDLELSTSTVFQTLITIYYIINYLKKGWSNTTVTRYVIPAYVNLTCIVAIQQYKLFSGGYNYEVAHAVLFLTVFYELYNYIEQKLQIKLSEKTLKRLKIISMIAVLVLPSHKIYKEYREEHKTHEGILVQELGGYLTNHGNDLISAKHILKNKKFFSEYASAQEVVNNSYQPSGIDYIIHVLGDKQREKYLTIFANPSIEYAITINKEFTPWAYWAERANWFWFRELYKNWHQVFKNDFEVIWKKSEKQNVIKGNFDIKVKKISHSAYELTIDLEDKITGYADVLIDYKVSRRTKLSSLFVIKTVLKVQNLENLDVDKYYESNFIRPLGREYIPIKIVNGKGSILVTSLPERNTKLTIQEVNCSEIIIERKI